MSFHDLPLARIDPNPNQPRKNFDAEALAELTESIRQFGLIQPITVRPTGEPIGERFQIVAGERRWRAAQAAGLDTLSCNVLTLSDEQTMILAITENVTRADMDAIEEANAYASLIAIGRSREDIATMFGKDLRVIVASLELLNLIETLQWAVAKGQITKPAGCFLSRLSPAAQQAALTRINGGEFANVDALLRYCTIVEKQEAQPDLFAMDEEDPLIAARRAVARTQIERNWNKLSSMTAPLGELMEMDAEQIAFALAGDMSRFESQLAVLSNCVRRALRNVREAVAIQRVSAV